MAVYRVLRPTFIQGALREPGEVLHHLPDGLEGNPDHWPASGPHLERVDVPSRPSPPTAPQPSPPRAATTRAKAKAATLPAVAPAPVSETPSEDKEKAAS